MGLALLLLTTCSPTRAPAPAPSAAPPAAQVSAGAPSVPGPSSIGGPGGPSSAPGGPSQPPPRLAMKTAYTTASAAYSPVWLAYESGAFAEQGIDAELVFIGAGQAILG